MIIGISISVSETSYSDKPGLLQITDDPFETIVIKFLTGAECSRLSGSCTRLYDRLQYCGQGNRHISLWMKLFRRDFPRLAIDASSALSAFTTVNSAHVQSQFYRARVTLLPKCRNIVPLTAKVNCLAALPNGFMASGLDDGAICVFTSDGKPATANTGGSVCSLSVLPDRRLACSIAISYPVSESVKPIQIWNPDLSGYREVLNHRIYGDPMVLPDGLIASYRRNSIVILTQTGQENRRLERHTDMISCLLLLANGRLASGSRDRTVILWDYQAGQMIRQSLHHSGPVCHLAELANGGLASVSSEYIWVWNEAGQLLRTFRGCGTMSSVMAITVVPNGWIATGSNRGAIRLFTITGEDVGELHLPSYAQNIDCLSTSSDGQLVSGSYPGKLAFWDVSAAELVQNAITRAEGMTRQRGYRTLTMVAMAAAKRAFAMFFGK